jgi:hypothetical protein
MEGLPISNQLNSNPVVSGVFAGSGITVNKNIGDVTVTAGGGGGTQTIVKYLESDAALFMTATYQTAYTNTITTTAASSLITVTCMGIAVSANPGYFVGRIIINGVASSPVYFFPVNPSVASDDYASFALQGAYRAPTPGTYTVNVQFSTPTLASATTIREGTLTLMTNMSG